MNIAHRNCSIQTTKWNN